MILRRTKPINFKITSLILILSLTFVACEEGNSFEGNIESKIVIDLSGESAFINADKLVFDENDPKNRYSRVDTTTIYGYGVDQNIPDSLKNSDLKVIISGKMRETESVTGNIAVTLFNSDNSTAFFNCMNADKFITGPNTWVKFTDSLMISSKENTNSAKSLRIYSGKGKGKGFFDVDDLKIELIKE